MQPDVALLTPLPEEKEALADALAELGHRPRQCKVGRLTCLRFNELGIVLAEGGHGKVQFGVQTQHLIDAGAFRLVVCAGAAGSLRRDVGVGDVVVGTTTVEHDYRLKFASRPLPGFAGDDSTLRQFGEATSGTDYPFAVHFGPIASGDEDVICSVRAAELFGATGALCVAWEGSGAARACRFSGLPFLELRAVTDSADKSAPTDFDAHLKCGMQNLARLVHDAWSRG